MEIWQAIILGLVQGLAEFLPISSSGHLLLMRNIMGLGELSNFFDIMVHLGTLLAVAIVLRKDIAGVFIKPKKILYLIIATVPAVITGFLLSDWLDEIFGGGKFLWIAFLLTAALLLACEIIEAVRAKKKKPLIEIGYKSSIAMGLMQAVALIPGLSRSGSTIFGGVVAGAKREQVATFSFLMSIPVILGSALLTLLKIESIDVEIWPLLFGMVFAFIGGLFAVKLMLRIIGKANYKWFSLYLVAMAIVSFIIL